MPSEPMPALHRHQIAWLSAAGWQRLLARDWDAEANECLRHWAERSLPVVVTSQPDDDRDALSLGLSAPLRWGRLRLPLRVQRSEVVYFDEFPQLEKLVAQLPCGARGPARQLALALRACGAAARVYGSHGWQHLTGLQHVRKDSDLDVWVGVSGLAQADAVAVALNAFDAGAQRLDGELVFGGDTAVAWREWLAWRSGRAQTLLVKRLWGAAMGLELAEVSA